MQSAVSLSDAPFRAADRQATLKEHMRKVMQHFGLTPGSAWETRDGKRCDVANGNGRGQIWSVDRLRYADFRSGPTVLALFGQHNPDGDGTGGSVTISVRWTRSPVIDLLPGWTDWLPQASVLNVSPLASVDRSLMDVLQAAIAVDRR